MSAQGHAPAGDAAASNDHHYEGTPADRPGPDEPRTPLWLPLVGLGLFLFTLLGYVMTRPPGKTGDELAKEAAPEASATPPAPPAAAPNPRMRRLPQGLPSALAPGGFAPGAAQPGMGPSGATAPGGAAPRPAMGAPSRVGPGAPRPRSAEPKPPPPAGAE